MRIKSWLYLAIFQTILLLSPITIFALDREPIKVGAILHLSGDLAMQGVAFREGIELAADEINKNGGIEGRPVKIIYEDTNFSTANVHRAAKKLIESDKVVAALISTFHETKTAGPLFERAGIPLVCLWDSTPELDDMGEFLFSIGTWLPATGNSSADFAYEKLKARKAAIISTTREWALQVGDDFDSRFKELGGEVVYHDNYNPGESDFKTLFLKIKLAKPDVLYAPVDDNIAAFFKQLRASGLDVPIIESDNLNMEWISSLGDTLEGVYQSQSMDPTNKEATKMVGLYKKKFGKDPTQLLFNAWGFDGLQIIAQALKQSENGSDESSRIREGLSHIKDYPGAIGSISISPKGSHKVGVRIFQIKDGQFQMEE